MSDDAFAIRTGKNDREIVVHTDRELPKWALQRLPEGIYSVDNGPTHLGFTYHYLLYISSDSTQAQMYSEVLRLVSAYLEGKLRPNG